MSREESSDFYIVPVCTAFRPLHPHSGTPVEGKLSDFHEGFPEFSKQLKVSFDVLFGLVSFLRINLLPWAFAGTGL